MIPWAAAQFFSAQQALVVQVMLGPTAGVAAASSRRVCASIRGGKAQKRGGGGLQQVGEIALV